MGSGVFCVRILRKDGPAPQARRGCRLSLPGPLRIYAHLPHTRRAADRVRFCAAPKAREDSYGKWPRYSA